MDSDIFDDMYWRKVRYHEENGGENYRYAIDGLIQIKDDHPEPCFWCEDDTPNVTYNPDIYRHRDMDIPA